MRRPTIVLARIIAYIDIADIAPGHVFLPDLVQELVKRYRFQKYPNAIEDYKVDKGIEFLEGKIGRTAIEKFVVWPNLMVLETRISTDVSKETLESLLLWATEKLGFTYKTGDIRRYGYINSMSFHSGAGLLYVDPILEWLARECSSHLTDIWQEPIEYKPTSLKLGHDPVSRQYEILPFSIERRGQARFSDNKYFSQAPLPTDVHVRLLEEFERRAIGGDM